MSGSWDASDSHEMTVGELRGSCSMPGRKMRKLRSMSSTARLLWEVPGWSCSPPESTGLVWSVSKLGIVVIESAQRTSEADEPVLENPDELSGEAKLLFDDTVHSGDRNRDRSLVSAE